jgi:hypothetical protein
VSGLTVAGVATTVGGTDTGGSIALTGLDAAAFDLSNVSGGTASEAGDTAGTVTLTGDINGGVELHANTDLGNAAVALDDGTGGTEALTLTAAQATGRVITDDANESLVITGLAGDTDLSGITLGGTGGITINMADEGAADVSGNANFLAADAGDTALAIALTDSTLTATAEQLHGATVTGADGADDDDGNGNGSTGTEVNESSVVLTGGVAAATGGNTAYNIIGLNDTSVDLTIAAGYTVSNFTEADGTTVRTATLTADAIHLAGQSVSGTGIVIGTGLDATAAGDYSGLTATTTQLQLAADAVLSSNVTLGTATVVIDQSDDAGDESLSVTSAQAASLNVLNGAGNDTSTLVITGTIGADTLDYSSTSWDIDQVTVNALAGDNVITGATGVASNVITTGSGNDTITTGSNADVLTGGTGSDVFDVHHGDADTDTSTTGLQPASVTIADFKTGVDYIDLDVVVTYVSADGTGMANVAAVLAAADTSFDSGTSVYVAWDVNNSDDAYLVADDDASGDVNAGDTLILLTDVNAANTIAATDII